MSFNRVGAAVVLALSTTIASGAQYLQSYVSDGA